MAYDQMTADLLRENELLKRKLDALAVAVRPVLRAHNSTTGHVTEAEITAAWAAYDAARRDG